MVHLRRRFNGHLLAMSTDDVITFLINRDGHLAVRYKRGIQLTDATTKMSEFSRRYSPLELSLKPGHSFTQ